MLQDSYQYRPQSKQCRTGGTHLRQVHPMDRLRKGAYRPRGTERLKKKYDESLATIQEKDDSLSAKQYIIIGLCILAAILAAALVFGAIVLLRFIILTRKQKKAISIANEHNELKTKFIQNISAQMEPTLDTLDASLPGVKALHAFSNHIQELSELETTLSEPYEVQEKNISTFL